MVAINHALADLLLVAGHLDTNNAAPSRMDMFTLLDRETLETPDPAILEGELDILRAETGFWWCPAISASELELSPAEQYKRNL